MEALKAITQDCCEGEKLADWFWEMFEDFSQKERRQYLKFVWGRANIPADTSDLKE